MKAGGEGVAGNGLSLSNREGANMEGAIMRLMTRDQFAGARKLHRVPMEDGVGIGLLDPTLADVKALSKCKDDFASVAKVLQPLVVGEDREPVFATGDELAAALSTSAFMALCEFIGHLYDRAAAEKNSPVTPTA